MTKFHDCDKCHMRPGSASARLAECRCPVAENRRGHQDPKFTVVTLGCPVHAPDDQDPPWV